MGYRFRRSVKILPGVRLNFSQRGTGVSFGVKGARYSISPTGRRTVSTSIPGTGISYVETIKGSKSKQKSAETRRVFLERNKTTVLLLCVFLGVFGIHRFYTGKSGTGWLWLFTMGLCGFGWLIDVILILTDNYKDIFNRPLLVEQNTTDQQTRSDE